MGKLGKYARKGAKVAFKPISLAILGTIMAVSISNQSQAQVIESDILWGTGTLHLFNDETGYSIPNLALKLKPLDMEEFTPDTVFEYNMGLSSMLDFSLPVRIDTTYIDTTTIDTLNIITNKELLKNVKTQPNIGSDFNMFFSKHINANIFIHNIAGQQIFQDKISDNKYYNNLSDLANGIYLINVQTDDNKSFTQKFVKTNTSPIGQIFKPEFENHTPSLNNSEYNFKNLQTASATYKVSWDSIEGYYGGDTTLTIHEGDNSYIPIFINPVPITVLNFKINAWNLMDSTSIDSALVYIKDSSGNIDSLRTGSDGSATFTDLEEEETFTIGIGKDNYKFWEGMQITLPSADGYGDTLTTEKNYTLIPDTVHSGLNDTTVFISTENIALMIRRFNIQIALYDTIHVWHSPSFSQAQLDGAEMLENLFESYTGIPTKIHSQQFIYPIPNYNPYTTTPDSVGVNISPGSSNCTEVTHILPSGEHVNLGANITNSISFPRQFFKEYHRMLGMKEVVTRPSNMNPTGTDVNDIDIAIDIISYNLGRNHFKLGKHDVDNVMEHLRDEPTYLQQTKSPK